MKKRKANIDDQGSGKYNGSPDFTDSERERSIFRISSAQSSPLQSNAFDQHETEVDHSKDTNGEKEYIEQPEDLQLSTAVMKEDNIQIQEELAKKDVMIAKLKAELAQRDVAIAEEKLLSCQRVAMITELKAQLAQLIRERCKWGQKDETITQLKTEIIHKSTVIVEKDNVIIEKDKLITEKNDMIAHLKAESAQKDTIIVEKDKLIAGKDELIAEKDATITRLKSESIHKDNLVVEKDKLITERSYMIACLKTESIQKDTVIAGKDKMIAERDERIAKHTVPTNPYQSLNHTVPTGPYQSLNHHTVPTNPYQSLNHTVPTGPYQSLNHTVPTGPYQSLNSSVNMGQTSNPTPNLPVSTNVLSRYRPSMPIDTNFRENRYLFRDSDAFSRFNLRFRNSKLSECYFFKVGDGSSISDWENEKLEQYLEQWSWRPLIEFNEKFSLFHTQLFYANMKLTDKPWGVNTYVCGKEIVVTIPPLCEWFGLKAKGQKIYAYKNWPDTAEGTMYDYKCWFCSRRNYQDFNFTFLPALHRLLLCFTKDILIPKITTKRNMEMNNLFYLHHLLCMDKRFNIPYIILSHMRTACQTMSNLPYAHLITKILQHHGINLQGTNILAPTNLLKVLPHIGWEEINSVWTPEDDAVNTWIKMPGAKVNQYDDPNTPCNATQQSGHSQLSECAPTYEGPQCQPEPRVCKPTEPPTSASLEDKMNYLMHQIYDLSTGFQSMRVSQQTHQAYSHQEFERLDQFSHQLMTSWYTVHNQWDYPSGWFVDIEMQAGDGPGDGGEANKP